MERRPLHIVTSDPNEPRRSFSRDRGVSPPQERAAANRAHYERLWLLTPEIFDTNRNAIERERIHRLKRPLKELVEARKQARAADLGFGWGTLTTRLCDYGATVDAVDIASQALQYFESRHSQVVRLYREALPESSLAEHSYDVVLCSELIADMHPNDQRLLISEIYRLLKTDGTAVIATALDIDSEGALQQLCSLVETELMVERIIKSYHAYYIRLLRLLRYPARIVRMRADRVYYDQQLGKRGRMAAGWLRIQCRQPFYAVWWFLELLTRPLAQYVEQSSKMLRMLESLCRTFKPEDGISHVILLARRKSLEESAEAAASTMSRPLQHLRERVWE